MFQSNKLKIEYPYKGSTLFIVQTVKESEWSENAQLDYSIKIKR